MRKCYRATGLGIEATLTQYQAATCVTRRMTCILYYTELVKNPTDHSQRYATPLANQLSPDLLFSQVWHQPQSPDLLFSQVWGPHVPPDLLYSQVWVDLKKYAALVYTLTLSFRTYASAAEHW
jgi:hypothetical protein